MYFFFQALQDLVAVETLAVFVSSILAHQAVFVIAITVAAFVNGLWMCTDGFPVTLAMLNVIWKDASRYINYQGYAFQPTLVTKFDHRVFGCAGSLQAETGYCLYLFKRPRSRWRHPRNSNVGGVQLSYRVRMRIARDHGWSHLYRILALLVLVLKKV